MKRESFAPFPRRVHGTSRRARRAVREARELFKKHGPWARCVRISERARRQRYVNEQRRNRFARDLRVRLRRYDAYLARIAEETARDERQRLYEEIQAVQTKAAQAKPKATKTTKAPPVHAPCANCGATTTTCWRRGPAGASACNRCGLFFQKHGVCRPCSTYV